MSTGHSQSGEREGRTPSPGREQCICTGCTVLWQRRSSCRGLHRERHNPLVGGLRGPVKSSRAFMPLGALFFSLFFNYLSEYRPLTRGLLISGSIIICTSISQIDTATENPRFGAERGPRARIGLIPPLGTILIVYQIVTR